jgi:hypothetical protein
MFDKISNSVALMGASWNLLRETPKLLVFPLVSSLCLLAITASFAAPLVMTESWMPPADDAPTEQKVVYYSTLFAIYFCDYAASTFFNIAVVSGTITRMTGGEPTVRGCFGEAMKRLPLILGWAAISATVGIALRIAEDRSPRLGGMVAGLLGSAWALVSFLVVPLLVARNLGPIGALTESASLLRRTWGDQLIGNFGFGLLFALLCVPGCVALMVGCFALDFTHQVAGGVLIGLGLLYLVVLVAIHSALEAVFQTAVYLHTQGVHYDEFSPEFLASVIESNE